MKNTVNRILLLISISSVIATLILFFGSVFKLFSVGSNWGNLLMHCPGVTFFFWQLYTSRTGKRWFTRQLPILITICGMILGIILMFVFSYNPLGGFLLILLSILHTAGALLAVIFHSIVRLFCKSSADKSPVSTASDDT